MTTYSTISVRQEHVQRAREIARHFEMNTGGLVGTLIDNEYRRVFSREPELLADLVPQLSGKKLIMQAKDGQKIELLLSDAPEIADIIYKVARDGGRAVVMKVEGLHPITVSAKGRGIVIESLDSKGKPSAKITLARSNAMLFAAKLKEAVVGHLISQ